MASANLVDYLVDKLTSYSSTMRSDIFQTNFSSFLMSGKNSQQQDFSKMISEARESSLCHIQDIYSNYQFCSLLRPFGILRGPKYSAEMEKPGYFNNLCENIGFSPHLFNLVSDSYRYKRSHSDLPFIPSSNMFLNPVKESVLSDSSMMSQQPKVSDKSNMCEQPTDESKISLDVNCSVTKKSEPAAEISFSPSLRLNLELAHRKTKEMNKRSKRRRRRQKRIQHLNVNNSASASDNDSESDLMSPVTDSVCISAGNPDFECTLSVTHTLKMSPQKTSFLIPVETDSDDDSDWETFDEVDLSRVCNRTSGCEVDCNTLSCDSSPIKLECLPPLKCNVKVAHVMSFIVPGGDSSDNDSDWDICETEILNEDTGFEFTGLFLTNLCAPSSLSSKSACNSSVTSEEESKEMKELNQLLLDVNKKWTKFVKEDIQKPKSPPKVSFAPDENLVQEFPVEMLDRKGEWEVYATERLRFKRKIDELEKILSPCLRQEHRSKIFIKYVEPKL